MNGMKKLTVLFLISLLTAISCFSRDIYQLNDSTVAISTQQLKQVNLIFLEHDKLSKENKELVNKVNTQWRIINNYQKIDSLRVVKELNYQYQIEDLNKQIKKKSKSSLRNGLLIGGICGISITSLIFLLAK